MEEVVKNLREFEKRKLEEEADAKKLEDLRRAKLAEQQKR